MLEDQGVTLARVRENLAKSASGSGNEPRAGEIPLSPRCERVLQGALRESLRLDLARVGTEHILLALTWEQAGAAARILMKLGADAGTMRHVVIERPLEEREGYGPEDSERQRALAVARMEVGKWVADKARGKLLSSECRDALDVLVEFATEEWLREQPPPEDAEMRRHYRHYCRINIEGQVLQTLFHPQLGPEGDHIAGHPGGPNSKQPAEDADRKPTVKDPRLEPLTGRNSSSSGSPRSSNLVMNA